MDPQKLEMIKQMARARMQDGQPQDAPLDPGASSIQPTDYPDFSQNPFAHLIAGMHTGQGAMQQPPQQPMPQQGGMGGQMEAEMPKDNQLVKGQGAGSTQYLLGAVQSLQKYIGESGDPSEIATARSIVMLLTKLIEKDQSQQTDQLPTHEAQMQVMQPPMA